MGASHGDPPPAGVKEPSPHCLELGMLQPNRDGTGQRENFGMTSSQAVPLETRRCRHPVQGSSEDPPSAGRTLFPDFT